MYNSTLKMKLMNFWKKENVELTLSKSLLLIIIVFTFHYLLNSVLIAYIINYFPSLSFELKDNKKNILSLLSAVIVAPLFEEYVFRYTLKTERKGKAITVMLLMFIFISVLFGFWFNNETNPIATMFTLILAVILLPAMSKEFLNFSEMIGSIFLNFFILIKNKLFTPKIKKTVFKKISNKRLIKSKDWIYKLESYINWIEITTIRYIKYTYYAIAKYHKFFMIISILTFPLAHYNNFIKTNPVLLLITVMMYFLPFTLIYSLIALKFKNGILYTIILHSMWNFFCYKDYFFSIFIK